MAFNIGLMVNGAKENIVDKTRYLSNQVTISCVLRDGSSVMSPVIEIETPTHIVDDVLVDYDVTKFNYAYIPFFNNRYYYIEDIVSVNNRLWELHLKTDVLYTYAAQIYRLNGVAVRTSMGNAYLPEFSEVAKPTTLKTFDDIIAPKNSKAILKKHTVLIVSGGA